MFKIGTGYDVHKLVEERELIIGGVLIPFEKGLLGHSDADVLTHAIIDALLGAAGLGDIGRHFPDTSEKYKGISSMVLLKEVKRLLDEKGYEISNVDATIIAQKPKLAAYIKQIEENLTNCLNCDINIKAKTEEGLGFTGAAARKKEEFIPIEENKVRMYVCGPTVYNMIHLGNARPYVVFDAFRRYLMYKGYDVKFVQNYTDIDDKIIIKANEENITTKEFAERYIKEAQRDAAALNVMEPSHTPKATEEINGIIEIIKTLIEKGYAYATNGGVFFSTGEFKEYGKLSHKNMEELEAGARVEIDEFKKNPMDFILWKPKKEGEPAWASPWGEGRPGWHIECSAMVKAYLGDEIDIHAGGDDLVFPHHENEIAQSEAANGKQFTRYWMHNALVNVNGQKMSKSKGNFFTLREVAEKYSNDVVRFFFLSVHYRSPINFSDEIIQAAKNGYERILNCLTGLEYMSVKNETDNLSPAEESLMQEAAKYKKAFIMKMDDDFNTADAVSAIFELVSLANKNIKEESSKAAAKWLHDIITELTGVLGLKFKREEKTGIDTVEIERLIEERTLAKKAKDFKRADQIREDLLAQGIVLEDTRTGTRYTYKGTGEIC
ncbi:cysteinyl-trna synthetase [Holotrichia oblita]|nr:cysteinyl-trna synthetase [Holotrichia oblita]